MKELLIIFSITLVANHIKAQVYTPQGGCGIKYEYDAAGNRIKRSKHCWTVGPIAQRPSSEALPSAASNKLALEVFPNPTLNSFTASLNSTISNGTITLQDLNGKVIQQKGLSGLSIDFNIESLAAGTYFVVLTQPNTKEKLMKKLIKQ